MLGGQVFDVIYENKNISDINVVKNIHLNKTAALIKTSIQMGAVCAGVQKKILDKLSIFGENIGLAFQIVDDILDITATTEQLGKPAKSDLKKNKSTYPSIIGIDKSRREADELLLKSLKILDSLNANTDALKEIAVLLVKREK